MYYGLIVISVLMFGAGFALKDSYRKQRGSSLKISMEFSLLSSLSGLIVLLAVNGFKFEFTWFTFIISLIAVAMSLLNNFCGFMALGTINLSLYSLFMMLGGMVLPFVQGIIFYGEPITVGKAICFALICVALSLTVEKGEKKRGGTIYYIGIFILNGMSGVMSKIFTSAPYEKTSAAGYSILSALISVISSALILLIFFRKRGDTPKMTLKSTTIGAAKGAINRLANYILVIALAHVEASVQYPMVTGGVMVVSTLICFFGPNKPKIKEILAIGIVFIGLMAMFLIPV